MSAAVSMRALPARACLTCDPKYYLADERTRDAVAKASSWRRRDDADAICSDCYARIADAQQRAAVPGKYCDAHFSNPLIRTWVPDAHAREAARAWDDDEDSPDRLVLVGPAGVGKTTIAAALINASIIRNARNDCTLFADAYTLATARRAVRLGREAAIVTRALEEHMLVIDDLGSEADDFAKTIAHVIHARHAEEATTIVTTAMTAAEIAAKYGGGIERRVFEGARVIDMTRTA